MDDTIEVVGSGPSSSMPRPTIMYFDEGNVPVVASPALAGFESDEEDALDDLLESHAEQAKGPRLDENAPFNVNTWLQILCSQVGVRYSDIPPDVLASIKLKRSKTGVNEVFFAWFTNKPPLAEVDFSPETVALLDSMISLQAHPDYQRAERSMKDHFSRATEFMRDAQERLMRAGVERMNMQRFLNEKPRSMVDDVKAVIADGWYKFEPELSHKRTAEYGTKTMVFTTPPVNLQFYNKKAGIDMNVPMGQYEVRIEPSTNSCTVHIHKDNIFLGWDEDEHEEPPEDTYIHPHVSEGSVCWGNAGDTVVKAFHTVNLKPILEALRVILTTYNEESPYRPADEFMLQYEGGEMQYSYIPNGSAWFREDRIRSGLGFNEAHVIQRFVGVDYGEVRLTTYKRVNQYGVGTNRRYIQTADSEYHRANDVNGFLRWA